MINRLVKFLGQPVTALLDTVPFKNWAYTIEKDEDLPSHMAKVYYEFDKNGCTISCDASGTIETIFLFFEDYGGFDLEGPTNFELSRNQVRKLYGAPSKSGDAHYSPGLGSVGAWERFDADEYAIHFQFAPDKDQLKQITLMFPAAAP